MDNSAFWKIWIVVGHSDEYGDVYLADYASNNESAVRHKVLQKMRREGFCGTVDHRLSQLCWRIVECELHPIWPNVQAQFRA